MEEKIMAQQASKQASKQARKQASKIARYQNFFSEFY